MRALLSAVAAAGVALTWTGPLRAAGEYPLTLVADVQVKKDETTITSAVTIRVDRLMEESRRTRVTDALRYGGYPNFLNTLRPLPPVGAIELARRKVEIRYAHEQEDEAGRRLVLVADRPLFFLGDPEKPRAGYELTLVELRFDAQGGTTGRIVGAARVKPAGGGGVVLDDYAEAPVELKVRSSP
jgi:hypothetical protein